MKRWILPGVALFAFQSTFAANPMVAMDEYHSNYAPPHYTYALGDTGIGGFTKFAGLVKSQNADTMSIHAPLDSATLSRVQVLIIVDPDTLPSKLISATEAAVVDTWVQQGGTLLLLANNAGKCEFTQYNKLAGKFGIKFNGDTYGTVYDLTPLPKVPFFAGCTIVHLKDISTLTVTAPAQAVLTLTGKVLMATATKGSGKVFAVGDPWLYNEYINTQDNLKAGTNLVQWLLTPNSTSIQPRRKLSQGLHPTVGAGYLLNGKQVSGSSSWAQALGLGVYGIHGAPAAMK